MYWALFPEIFEPRFPGGFPTMRTIKKRLAVSVVLTLVAAAGGVGTGYLLGRAISFRITAHRLQQDATRILTRLDSISNESHSVLAAMNASKYPFCSEANVAEIRKLILHSEFVKDAGRVRDGRIECTASLPRQDLPDTHFKVDLTQEDGTKIFRQLPMYVNGSQSMLASQQGDSFVVFSPYLRDFLGAISMHYAVTLTDSASRKASEVGWDRSALGGAITGNDGQGRVGDVLYSTRCSSRAQACITAFEPISEAIGANRSLLIGYLALGGVAGICFKFFLSLIYRRNRSIEQQLRRAIRKDKLRLVYQPIVDLTSRRIVGAEALARWTNEDNVAVAPNVFVRLAEERHFVGAITELVLRHAMRDFGAMLRGKPSFRLSINLAAADLADPAFLPRLSVLLEQAGVFAQSLAMEITESNTARYRAAMDTIVSLRQRGHSVQIDDFGTGYSSLSYLHDLSVDAIKIDQSFTRAIGTGAVILAILPPILAMAEALNLQVVVEGVETEQQADYFAGSHRPVLAQGWFFGRPVPAAEFHRLLAEDQQNAVVPAHAS